MIARARPCCTGLLVLALQSALGPRPARADEAPATQEGPAPAVEVTVRAPSPARDATRHTLPAQRARTIAGTEGDATKAIQALPGVGRPSFGSGQLVVWGSAPRETQVFVDGVPLPALYHLGGRRGLVNADLVGSIELVPGAYGAEHGRGLGGIVRLATRELPREGIHGYAGVDTVDASAMVTAALGERARVGVAGRLSLLDRLAAGLDPQLGDFFPIPHYRDVQAKASLELRAGESLDALAIGASDRLTRTIPSADPAAVRRERTATDTYRVALGYRRSFDDGATTVVMPFFGRDRANIEGEIGARPLVRSADTFVYGLRASYRARIADPVTLVLGVDALGQSASIRRAGTLTLPAREGDIAVFGQTPGDDHAADAFGAGAFDVAPYAAATIELGPITVTPGARLDAVLLYGDRTAPPSGPQPPIGYATLEGAVEPRLAIACKAHERLTVHASAGLFHQPPDPEDRSAVFGNPRLALARAFHVGLGQALRVTPTLTSEVIGYYKSLDELVVRSRLVTPALARALTQNGEGRSYGVQILVRQNPWKGFWGWAAYTIGRSERKIDGDPAYRLFDEDQPHVLSVVASQEHRGWVFGLRFRYASGFPRTPVVGAFYDARGDEHQPIFGAHNSVRLPPFYQVDARVERSVRLGRVTARVYLDVQNLSARESPEELAYSHDYAELGFIHGLPTLAVLGVRVES